jgi:Amt family ammonium transporter
VGAIPVHLFNGIWGTLSVGLFTSQAFMLDAYGVETASYGLLLGGGINMLLIQALGIAAVGVWVVGTSVLLFGAIRLTVGLRVSQEAEEIGLDVSEHRMEAYPEFTGARDPFGVHAAPAPSGPPPEAGDGGNE